MNTWDTTGIQWSENDHKKLRAQPFQCYDYNITCI